MSPRTALPLHIEYALLGLIRRQPIHGYELLRQWQDHQGIGLVWSIKPGLLYAALEKLEQYGYIIPSLVGSPTSPVRKEYHITPAGEDAFLGWMVTPVRMARDIRQDFLLKLYFAEDIPPTSLQILFQQQEELCVYWLDAIQKQLEICSGYEKIVMLFRHDQVRAILAWLQVLEPNQIKYFSGGN